MGLAAVVVVALLIASAVLTAAHDAAFGMSRGHVRALAEEGFDGAAALNAVRDDEHSVQASVRVVTQALDLAALGVIAVTGVSTWGRLGQIPSIIVGGFLVVAIADLIPHLIAARSPVRLALSASSMLLRVSRLTRPLTAPVEALEERIGGREDGLNDEHRELREIQEIGEEEGLLDEGESHLVERAFRLDDLTAWDVMVPRVDIFGWEQDRRISELVDDLPDVRFSRVPIYSETIDDVTGVVYLREVYARFAKGESQLRLADIAHEPFFVPGSASCTRLLEDFQARRIHMGIVADEHGGIDGLVTLEDVLEELVGEIRDETDEEEEEIARLSDDTVECDAGVDLRDLEEALDVTIPQGEHRSLNGFLLDELGHVPAPGETLETADLRIDVLDASETQVLRARVTRLTLQGGG